MAHAAAREIPCTDDREARLTRSCARIGFKLVPATAGRFSVIDEGGEQVRARLTLGEVEKWIRVQVGQGSSASGLLLVALGASLSRCHYDSNLN